MYLSMHNNGLSRTSPKNGTWRIFDGLLHILHCGNTKLPHNRKVHHSFDELDLGHVIVEELLELVTAWPQGRPNRRAAPGNAAHPSGDPLRGPKRTVESLCSPFHEGRRRSAVWSSGQLLRRECHPSSDRLAAPADPLADT